MFKINTRNRMLRIILGWFIIFAGLAIVFYVSKNYELPKISGWTIVIVFFLLITGGTRLLVMYLKRKKTPEQLEEIEKNIAENVEKSEEEKVGEGFSTITAIIFLVVVIAGVYIAAWLLKK